MNVPKFVNAALTWDHLAAHLDEAARILAAAGAVECFEIFG